MRKIKFTKNHKNYAKGDIVQIGNNEAWGLVEAGVARYYTPVSEKVVTKYKTKELRPRKTKSYKTK